jgi:outer membrane lipoprotein-sorting protein
MLNRALLLVLGTFWVATPTASALTFDDVKAKGAQALLEYGDKLHNGQQTQEWLFKMTMKSANGEPRVVKFTVQQKDRTKRLVRFIAGDAKGMSVLMRGNKMYVYSPQTDNIRRVASHARRQTLMGSNMTFSDMSTIDFSKSYNATFDQETGEHLWLSLQAKEGMELDWGRLRLRVEKKNFSFSQIEYYDGKKLKRVQYRDNYKSDGGVPTYQKVKFVDKANGYSTTMDMLSQKIGGDLPNSIFKKRNLVRGQ